MTDKNKNDEMMTSKKKNKRDDDRWKEEWFSDDR